MYPKASSQFANHLLTLLKRLPDENWDMRTVSSNPCILWRDIEGDPDIEWDTGGVMINPNVSSITASSNDFWGHNALMALWNANASWGLIQGFIGVYNTELSLCCNITPTIIRDYPNVDWYYGSLSDSRGLTQQFILDNLQERWDWWALSCNPVVTMTMVRSHPHLPWNYTGLSVNPNLTWGDVVSNLWQPWDWECISAHKCVTMSIVVAYPDLPWEYIGLTRNPNITFEMMFIDYSDRPWYIPSMSLNPNLTWEFVVNHPRIKWNYAVMSENTFGHA